MRHRNPFLILLLCIILTPSVLEAKHIVGGEITYRVISKTANANRYRFTMRIYRDCYTNGGAQLDQLAPIGVYISGNSSAIESFTVPLGNVTRLSSPNLPCLIPPDVCVQEGLYEWEKELEIIDQTYTLLYQRCCRNETINNITAPGDVGATYEVSISPLAQRTGNNSPIFRQFPPIVICANENLNFDHSATDAENDQLVYEFCWPLTGGGKLGGSNCGSTTPNPPCWPAPGFVNFVSPTYTYDKPLAGDPIVKIDSRTGRITGIPQTQGQFVVGVCVKEYRNGQLLSTLRRDFQFNVAKCDPTVRGKITADSVWGKTYLLKSCGSNAISINNLSTERVNITAFEYNVNINQQIKVFTEWSPTIAFPDTGVYYGNLLLNKGTQCADTIDLVFRVFPAIKTDFSISYDTCIAGPVTFRDKSNSPGGEITKWRWSFGDGKETNIANPVHSYTTPGKKLIRLSIENEKGCSSDTVREIQWLPVPPLLVVEPSTFTGCSPAQVNFKNLSAPIDSTYTIRWDFGDGGKSSQISPTYSYPNPGTYSVSLEIVSPIGCKTSQTFPNWIKVKQGSKADFSYSPEQVSSFRNTVSFTDKSQNANRWQWFFGNLGYSALQNPTFKFRDSGVHRVKLMVSNNVGCSDSIVKVVDVIPQVTYWLPNAFTPNDDGHNDEYRGTGVIEGIKNFEMRILNRWGELIFRTSDPSEGWNGLKNNKGEASPQGVYLCHVTYTSPRNENFELKTYATLLR